MELRQTLYDSTGKIGVVIFMISIGLSELNTALPATRMSAPASISCFEFLFDEK